MNNNILKQTFLYSNNEILYFVLLNSRIFSDIKDNMVLWPIIEFKKYFKLSNDYRRILETKLYNFNDYYCNCCESYYDKYDYEIHQRELWNDYDS